jgi:hypothetical protein
VGGFHIDGDSCVENVCQCENGVASTDANCQNDGDNSCETCNIGFQINGNVCIANQCHCNHGQAATGLDCSSNGLHVCSSCENGYEINGDAQCEDTNECSAENVGQHCPNGTCMNHNGGFTCQAHQCFCSQGQAVDANACTVNGAHHCESCNNGFELNNIDECVDIDECSAENVGTHCPDGTCSNHVGGFTCVPNEQCSPLSLNGPVSHDGTIRPLNIGANKCLYKRYLGFAYAHEVWLWNCNSHHGSGKYQWHFDESTGLIKIIGSEMKDPAQPYCLYVHKLSMTWTQRAKIKLCDANDKGQQFMYDEGRIHLKHSRKLCLGYATGTFANSGQIAITAMGCLNNQWGVPGEN